MSHGRRIIVIMEAPANSLVSAETDIAQEKEQGQDPSFRWEELKRHPDYQDLFQDPCSFAEGALGLRSPLNLPDIERALNYLQQALKDENRQICIVGDRDVDGVSSTALLGKFLRERHKGKLELIVSDEGDDYGLSGELFHSLESMESETLLILLDMGSSHGPEVGSLIEQGKSVIILDHHQLHNAVPDSSLCAFVNPQRNKTQHPRHEGKIATAGLVFKFLFAFALSHIRDWQRVYLVEIGSGLHAFRCGLPLGVRSSMREWQAWERERLGQEDAKESWEYVLLSESGGKSGHSKQAYEFSPAEWLRIKNNPDHAGQVLLARIIETRPRLRKFVRDSADLAALGTVADMVPLIDENRSLVRIGIGQALFDAKRGQRPYALGYDALMRSLTLNPKRLLSRDLSWSLSPAINAAGRMGNTRLALDLLLSSDKGEADVLARKLVLLNESRKRRTSHNEKIVHAYFKARQEKLKAPFLFCYHPQLEPGVSGIIAARLSEQYKKSVVYINKDGDHARGSARSWGNFNVLHFLDSAASLFIQFGGHPEAAGFSIAYENIEELEKRLLASYAKIRNSKMNLEAGSNSSPKYHIDLNPQELDYAHFLELQKLEPFGPHNPDPILRLSRVKILRPHYMREGLHVFFQVSHAPSELRFVAWRKGKQIKNLMQRGSRANLYGCLETDNFFQNWNGSHSFRFCFRIDDIEEVF